MFRIKFGVATFAMALTTLCGAALAQQNNQSSNAVTPGQRNPQMRRMMMRRRARGGMVRGLRQLNLTDQQREQMRAIVQTQAQSTQTQRQELRQLAQKRRTGTLTAAETARAKELRQQLMQSRQGVHTQMLGVLTPEQKAKLDERIKARQGNRGRLGPRRQKFI